MTLRTIPVFLIAFSPCVVAEESDLHEVEDLRITILSTMLAGDPLYKGIGEWGFAALVEADGHRLLFDTGLRPETVLHNARELGIDLSDVEDVVLSHHHIDHTGGLITLRHELSANNEASMSRVMVAPGMFWRRGDRADGADRNRMVATRSEFEALGGSFVEYHEPTEIAPGVWFTGPVPRIHDERNWSGSGRVQAPEDGWVEDNIPESASLVINTAEGLIILSGCGHAGIVNIIEYANKTVRVAPILAAIGGFHLLSASDEHLAWTAEKLEAFEVRSFMGAHCTGIDATYQIRHHTHLERGTAMVGAVGATFDLKQGINPRMLAR